MTIALAMTMAMISSAHAAAPKFGSSDAPIEITSDTLEVFQEENRAVFIGDVVAIQEDMRLKSDKMTVFYRSQEEKQQQGGDSIQKIIVEGNVFLTTPEETASGLNGLYDVEHKQVVLNEQVVLTRQNNTLKGDKLVYDMNTGKSVVTGGVAAETQGGKKERVRALFIPDKAKKTP